MLVTRCVCVVSVIIPWFWGVFFSCIHSVCTQCTDIKNKGPPFKNKVCTFYITYTHRIYIWTLITKTLRSLIRLVLVCLLYARQAVNKQILYTMCMHEDSPLQKNAPIFGNGLSVAYYIIYVYLSAIITCNLCLCYKI